MQQTITAKLLPSEAANEQAIKEYIVAATATEPSAVTGFTILRQSIDARGKQTWINLSIKVFINEPFRSREKMAFIFPDVSRAQHSVIIIGAGPAGLFAALRLIEQGIRPIILERGKDTRSRRRDLALLNKEGIVNPESNYCFGEGGAGTYSDGKLYTRSTKRGDLNRILNLLVEFGATEQILYDAHPHIGTNKLPHIITAMRKKITDCGGLFLFEKKVVDFIIRTGQGQQKIKGVKAASGEVYEGEAVILATGHSARDIFQLLHAKKITIALKPFALGVRVEHPQSLIDNVQYHCKDRGPFLPPAAYNWAEQVNGRGVFSFCMCPGGIIAPAATNPGELVVNGWSPSKRNNPYANSGIVVPVEEKDLLEYKKHGPLAALFFQQSVEQLAFEKGGGQLVAPAQALMDFIDNKNSASLPRCSYVPGIQASNLKEVLPAFIHKSLQQGFIQTAKKIKGYLTNDAVVLATESRTSSPVRIPRDPETLEHPQVAGLYPCGEGAGYAGGIVSAAMDGERIANRLALTLAG